MVHKVSKEEATRRIQAAIAEVSEETGLPEEAVWFISTIRIECRMDLFRRAGLLTAEIVGLEESN